MTIAGSGAVLGLCDVIASIKPEGMDRLNYWFGTRSQPEVAEIPEPEHAQSLHPSSINSDAPGVHSTAAHSFKVSKMRCVSYGSAQMLS